MPPPQGLPKFANPPVAEVALSVTVHPLTKVWSAHVGILWTGEFRRRFPKTVDQPPLESPMEVEIEPRRSAGPAIQFEPISTPRLRTWFLNEQETELLQFQHDKIARNWRRTGPGDSYPSYDNIRGPFEGDLKLVEHFLEENQLGSLQPTQCEVTYVNHIILGNGKTHADVSAILRNWHEPTREFLPRVEDAKLAWRYEIRDGKSFVGRLHISFQPAYRSSDGKATELFLMTLTARGKPLGDGIGGALAFLDLGHEWIVRGFADLTTPEMHQVWQRQS